MVHVISRKEWGATPWRRSVSRVSAKERTEFFVHYHGTPPPLSVGTAVPKTVERIHLSNGWVGTGYNFIVDQNGVAYEGRGWDLVGAHCPNHNRSGIGVYVAVGGNQMPTPAALATVRALYEESCDRSNFKQAKRGHRDGKSTACPGNILYAWVRSGMPVETTPAGPAVKPAPVRPIDEPSLSPVLRRGSNGRHVVNLQNTLIALGWDLKDGADGSFGPDTERVVKLFQKAAGISQDGVVGPVTRAALTRGVRAPEEKPAPKPSPSKPAPKPAVKKPAVKKPSIPRYPGATRLGDGAGKNRPHAATRAFQQRLRDRGWRIEVDGSHGPATQKVIRQFQENKRLAVDGVGGPATWAALWALPVT